jgi:hypothetical protein
MAWLLVFMLPPSRSNCLLLGHGGKQARPARSRRRLTGMDCGLRVCLMRIACRPRKGEEYRNARSAVMRRVRHVPAGRRANAGAKVF